MQAAMQVPGPYKAADAAHAHNMSRLFRQGQCTANCSLAYLCIQIDRDYVDLEFMEEIETCARR